jgi:hypothetical protein
MEDFKYRVIANEQGQVYRLEFGGMLVLANAQRLKSEFVGIVERLSSELEIIVEEPEDIDLSFIQRLVAFIKRMDQLKVVYRFDWKLNEEQKFLFENVGLNNELFLSNSYV